MSGFLYFLSKKRFPILPASHLASQAPIATSSLMLSAFPSISLTGHCCPLLTLPWPQHGDTDVSWFWASPAAGHAHPTLWRNWLRVLGFRLLVVSSSAFVAPCLMPMWQCEPTLPLPLSQFVINLQRKKRLSPLEPRQKLCAASRNSSRHTRERVVTLFQSLDLVFFEHN